MFKIKKEYACTLLGKSHFLENTKDNFLTKAQIDWG